MKASSGSCWPARPTEQCILYSSLDAYLRNYEICVSYGRGGPHPPGPGRGGATHDAGQHARRGRRGGTGLRPGGRREQSGRLTFAIAAFSCDDHASRVSVAEGSTSESCQSPGRELAWGEQGAPSAARRIRGGRSTLARACGLAVVIVCISAAVGIAQGRRPLHKGLPAKPVASAPAGEVIVIMKDQAAPARVADADTIDEVERSGGDVTYRYQSLNGFAANVDADERARLEADPEVKEVIPDAVVARPRPRLDRPRTGGGAPANATPRHGVCPHRPEQADPRARGAADDETSPAPTRQGQARRRHDGQGRQGRLDGRRHRHRQPRLHPSGRLEGLCRLPGLHRRGADAPTSAAEAFGDASAIAAQGRTLRPVQWVSWAHPLPKGCTIMVRGVAPGA